MNYTTDKELWQAFKDGNREAFTQLYNQYIEDLLIYGYRVTSDRQLIRDSIQDLFLYLWRSRASLTDTDSIKFYLYRSLRNRIIRNSEKNNHVAIDFAHLFENIIGELSFEDNLIANEQLSAQLQQLKQAIQQLPKRQQEIIQLRYYHDFGFEEIAEMMQINNQSVRNLLHRAITELRHHFSMILYLFVAYLKP
ncbi:MAG: sigma-70 family RNA polymerase sigma factor [Spirosomataceae bacterium]